MRAEGDTRPWLEVLEDAWEFFRTKRQLKERSQAPRDFEKESWKAVVNMYGYYVAAPGVRGVRGGAASKAMPRAKPSAASAASVASVQPVPKLLARQAIRVQPVPKQRGKPKDRQC